MISVPRARRRRETTNAIHAPVGVIVKTWNTGEVTRHCLDLVAAADVHPAELAIVDLGDDRATRAHAESLSRQHGIALRWLAVGQRIAPGEANRRGAAALTSPLGCLLDNDVFVPRNWLGSLVSLLDSPRMALAAPLRPDPFITFPGQARSTEAMLDDVVARTPPAGIVAAFTAGIPFEQFAEAVATANGLDRVTSLAFPSFLSSCCLCFKRGPVEDAGGLADPAFDAQYGSEDVDLSWRVLDAGYAIARTAEVFVLHLRHTSLVANGVDLDAELRSANRVLYDHWRDQLVDWGRERLRRGDMMTDLARRFIIRELMKNTSFAKDLGAQRRS